MKSDNSVSIQSITAGPRLSNFELLRILAMFLVLVVHADFFSLGAPAFSDFTEAPLNAWTRTVFESLSIVCVNVFVLISGWFGIRPSKKGLLNFLFQCLFFSVGIFLVFLAAGKEEISNASILVGCMLHTGYYWFIPAYLLLYILAPALNIFIKKASGRTLALTLAGFFLIQTISGWPGFTIAFKDGYSTISFIGLYLLSAFTKRYLPKYCASKWGGVFLLLIAVNSVFFYLLQRFSVPHIRAYSYINPIVIAASLALLLTFANLKIKPNRAINWISKSAFAVYLFHLNYNIVIPYFKRPVLDIYAATSGPVCLGIMLLFLIAVFCAGILLDQPRKYLWKIISRHI